MNYPWKIYEGDSFELLTFHYISEAKHKSQGDEIRTVEGNFIIKRISEETREIWV